MPRIAVCVDDYGLHPAVDDAILLLAARQRVTATSCVVGGPAWHDDAPRLKEAFEAGLLDAGLHLDLTEFPFDAGLRRPVGRWMRDTVLRRVERDRVHRELCAQLDAFELAMRRAPAHVDGHQHIHQFPVVRDIVVAELVRRYGASGLPWLRNTRGASRWRLKGRVIEAMGSRALARLARAHGFAQNASLLGVYDFRGGPARFRALMGQWLRDARDGDLLMCHVATAIVPGDEIAAPRVDEYRVFADDGFDALVAKAGVTIGRMSEIVRDPAATMAGFRRGG